MLADGNKRVIDVNSLRAGKYFVKIYTRGTVETKPLIIQK